MTKRLLISLAALMLAAFALSACGGDDDEGDTSATSTPTETAATTETTSGGGGGATIAIAADPGGELAFTETEVSAEAGSDTLEFTNDSSVPHDVVVENDSGEAGRTDVIQGDTTSTKLELEPGTYTFYCSVPGHRDAGMEGTLDVK